MKPKPRMDFSLGDPLYPLTEIANIAFQKSLSDLHQYHIMAHASFPVHAVRPILENLAQYFTAKGIYDHGYTGCGINEILMTGGGTTEAYELIIRRLAQDVRERCAETGAQIKPAVIAPVPTYGFFLDNPRAWGMEVIRVERNLDKGGRLDPELLAWAFEKADESGYRVVAYYDCDPHNPLGFVRTREETRQIAKVIAAYNDKIHEEDGKNGLRRWTGAASRCRIIDDRVYAGLEYDRNQETCSFAELDNEIPGTFRNTFTLFGLSKAGLVSLRAGAIVADSRDIGGLQALQAQTSYFPPKISMHALEAFYTTDEKLADIRDEHLKKMNADHEFSGKFMKALLVGFSAVPEAVEKEKARMVDIVSAARKVDPKEAAAQFEKGIPGVRVVTTPQAGFFHVLDMNSLKGREYNDRFALSFPPAPPVTVKDAFDLKQLLDDENLSVASGSWSGLQPDNLILRASFAKSFPEIVDFSERIGAVVARCSGPAMAPAK
jgi:aspartate/methionine/tyrosine aminotransferase